MIEQIANGSVLRCTGCGIEKKIESHATMPGFEKYHADCDRKSSRAEARAAIKKRVESAMYAQHQHRERSKLAA